MVQRAVAYAQRLITPFYFIVVSFQHALLRGRAFFW